MVEHDLGDRNFCFCETVPSIYGEIENLWQKFLRVFNPANCFLLRMAEQDFVGKSFCSNTSL